jgi:hypothetical protein
MKMKSILLGLMSVSAVFLMTGCAPKTVSKGEEFPKMYEESPRSLLVLPPMNESTDAEAKGYYMTTIEEPIALAGYYVFPVEVVSDIMKQEGVYDTELLYKMPMDKFAEYFGADAVLFTRIKKWDVSYMVLASSLTVTVEAEIVSTKTSEQLWTYTGSVTVDLSGGNSGGGIEGLVLNAVMTAVNTAAADYVTYARQANTRLFSSLPYGPYHPQYRQDQSGMLIDQTPKD